MKMNISYTAKTMQIVDLAYTAKTMQIVDLANNLVTVVA